MVGFGSNVNIRDGGMDGVVICPYPGLSNLALHQNGVVRVEAGVPCAKVAKFCVKQGLVGAEFFVGIPGTMGGALMMNAGAFGGETWRLVIGVDTVSRDGQFYYYNASDFQVGYRQVVGLNAEEWFVASYLKLIPGDASMLQDQCEPCLNNAMKPNQLGCPVVVLCLKSARTLCSEIN